MSAPLLVVHRGDPEPDEVAAVLVALLALAAGAAARPDAPHPDAGGAGGGWGDPARTRWGAPRSGLAAPGRWT